MAVGGEAADLPGGALISRSVTRFRSNTGGIDGSEPGPSTRSDNATEQLGATLNAKAASMELAFDMTSRSILKFCSSLYLKTSEPSING